MPANVVRSRSRPFRCLSFAPCRLMASVEALKARLAENKALSRQLAAKAAALEGRPRETGGLARATVRMQSVALRIYAMADFDTSAALAYLRSMDRQADSSHLTSWLSKMSMEEQKSLAVQPIGSSAKLREWADAQRFLKEHRLVAWVKSQNKKSIAPSPGMVLQHAAAAGGLPCKKGSQYRWVQRVMARWGGRKGVFANGNQLTPEEFEGKAAVGFRGVSRAVLFGFRGTILRPAWWSPFGSPCFLPQGLLHADRLAGSFRVPRKSLSDFRKLPDDRSPG